MIIEITSNYRMDFHYSKSIINPVVTHRMNAWPRSIEIIKEINSKYNIIRLSYKNKPKPSVRDIQLVLVPKGHYK